MSTRAIRIAALVLPPLLLGGCLWPLEQVEETKRRGDIIRVALQHHRERFGSYPAELRELVPDGLSAIPLPTVGRKRWEYRTWPEGGIRQSYRLKAETWFQDDADLLADSKQEGWMYDTK